MSIAALGDYRAFIAQKKRTVAPAGFDIEESAINPALFPFQMEIVRRAVKLGRMAVFADCGLGKTFMQLEWARIVADHTGGRVLILAPLGVARQTEDEAAKIGIRAVYSRDGKTDARIVVANYEILDHFDGQEFAGVVLDESSILKNFTGVIRNKLIDRFAGLRFKLACTATPAPNDFMELGNHSEFLGAMDRSGMLSRFFVHDGGDTSQWRLKGHAVRDFWQWVASWSVSMRKPSDLGYSDEGYELPPVNYIKHHIAAPIEAAWDAGQLFAIEASGMSERRAVIRSNAEIRASMAAELVASAPNEPWVIWCEFNAEAEAYAKAIPGAVDLCGSLSNDEKVEILHRFSAGEIRVLITKPKIAGFGMNWQHCHNTIFRPMDSYEAFYQALRRFHRFGQKHQVNVHIIAEEREASITRNNEAKRERHFEIFEGATA